METPPRAERDFDVEHIKIVVLGAKGVGKTSLVRQFVLQQFDDKRNNAPTRTPRNYYPVIVYNDRMYEAKIVDGPVLPYFPRTSLQEWTDFRGFSLREASAYVLVVDASSSDESVQYARRIRDQIVQSLDRNQVPILVAANKYDLLKDDSVTHTVQHSSAWSSVARRDQLANMVKKSWQCGYVECSAKFNWRVVAIFNELMKAIDNRDFEQKQASKKTGSRDHRHNPFITTRCAVQ